MNLLVVRRDSRFFMPNWRDVLRLSFRATNGSREIRNTLCGERISPRAFGLVEMTDWSIDSSINWDFRNKEIFDGRRWRRYGRQGGVGAVAGVFGAAAAGAADGKNAAGIDTGGADHSGTNGDTTPEKRGAGALPAFGNGARYRISLQKAGPGEGKKGPGWRRGRMKMRPFYWGEGECRIKF